MRARLAQVSTRLVEYEQRVEMALWRVERGLRQLTPPQRQRPSPRSETPQPMIPEGASNLEGPSSSSSSVSTSVSTSVAELAGLLEGRGASGLLLAPAGDGGPGSLAPREGVMAPASKRARGL